MAPIAGKYQLLNNENLVEYFVKCGVVEEVAKKFNSLLPGLEFVVEGDKYIIKTDSGVKNTATSFKLGEEFDDAMPTGDVLKSVAKLEGNKIVINSKAKDGRTGVRSYEFTDSGCVCTLSISSDPVVAKRHYKRV